MALQRNIVNFFILILTKIDFKGVFLPIERNLLILHGHKLHKKIVIFCDSVNIAYS